MTACWLRMMTAAAVLSAAGPLLGKTTEALTLKVIRADSEEAGGPVDNCASNAVDGNPATFWHTQWKDQAPPCPHEIVLRVDPATTLKAVSYLPRQDGLDHGNIKDYELYLSQDGVSFSHAAAKGAFDNNSALQYALFEPTLCRYIKLVAKSEAKGHPWTAVAEIGVVQALEHTRGQAARCPLKHGEWKPLAALTDEFDGEQLDTLMWYPNCPGWLGREPGYFNPKNVRVSGGCLHLDAKKETIPNLPPAYHSYTTAFVKSRAKARYGYYEIRARAMDCQATSAFWFYDITPEIWTEIDVFEIGARTYPSSYYMNTHVFHTLAEDVHWDKSRIWAAPYNLSQEFHVYGLEWSPEILRFTVDGNVIREEKNTHWHQPLSLCFDSEIFPAWFGLPQDDALPATYSIDYVRAWTCTDAPNDAAPGAVEFEFQGRTTGAEAVYALTVEEGGVLEVTARGGEIRPERVGLSYVNDAFFAAQTAPDVGKRLTVCDRAGKKLSILITWSRTEPWNREERVKQGDGRPPRNGYYAVGVAVRPAVAKPRGEIDRFEFTATNGAPVRITVRN